MPKYKTKYWDVEVSDRVLNQRTGKNVLNIFIENRGSIESVLIDLPYRSKAIAHKISEMFVQWLKLTEEPLRSVDIYEQMKVFTATLFKLDELIWRKKCQVSTKSPLLETSGTHLSSKIQPMVSTMYA